MRRALRPLPRRRLLAAVLALVVCPPAGAEETAYVIDKLLVGVHQDEDLKSAIVKVLPTGTRLEVLARKDEVAQIKDPQGVTGWVDSAYLMPEPPAEQRLEQLREEKQALADRLKALDSKRKGGAGADDAAAQKIDELMNENTDLKSQLSAQKLKATELESQLADQRKAASTALPGGSVAGELQAANLKLTSELEELRTRNQALETRLGEHGPLGEVTTGVRRLSAPLVAALVLLLAAAFGGGLYCMDYLNRRRHGGFRI